MDTDLTNIIYLGAKIKFTNNSTTFYGFLVKIGAWNGSAQLLTLYGGTGYDVANSAITNPYYSFDKVPFAFDARPSSWTVEYKGTSAASQATPTQNTWYNVGSRSITIPIGVWRTYYQDLLFVSQFPTTTGNVNVWSTLSTANNSESDKDWTINVQAYDVAYMYGPVCREKQIEITTKTVYYLNLRTTVASMASIGDDATNSSAIIRAVCAYL